jgi:toxin ParE1/3/4
MARRVELHEEADLDAADAFETYFARSPRTARRFLTELDRVITVAAELPEMFQRIDDAPDFRKARLHRYPYSVVFKVSDDVLSVVAVAHQRRHADYWRART